MRKLIFNFNILIMNIFNNKLHIKLTTLIALIAFSLAVYAKNSSDNCIIMQSAASGTLQKNSSNYQLTLTKADPWFIYFNHTPQNHVTSAKFMTKAQIYQHMQQAMSAKKDHTFVAEILAFNANNTMAHYYVNINKISYDNSRNRVNYQLNLPNNNLLSTAKTKLKHVVMLINGNDICINCGGPW
jgi:hypothetical protein